jgi:hypothetical protein
MAETEYSQDNIAAIRTQLNNVERMTRLAIAANPNSQAHIENVFRRRVGSAELYLALESGPKTQEELTQMLDKSQPTVSRIVNHLHEAGLIGRLPDSTGVRWMWHEMERVLGISRVARRLATARPKTDERTDRPDAADVSTD